MVNKELPIKKVTCDGVEILLEASGGSSGGGGSTEWQPNPTWWDIEKIYNEDTTEGYQYKSIVLMYGDVEEENLKAYSNMGGTPAFRTSDGAFYDSSQYPTTPINHTWDLTKDKPCLVNGKEVYTTRYIIVYSNNNSTTFNTPLYRTLMTCGNVKGFYDKSANSLFEDRFGLEAVKQLDASHYTSTGRMFSYCHSLKRQPDIDISNSGSMGSMFYGCSSLKGPIKLNASKVTNFDSAFKECYSLDGPIEIDTSNGTDFKYMFQSCYSLKGPIRLNTSKSTTCNYMFSNCVLLEEQPDIDTGNCKGFGGMFQNCYSLKGPIKLNTSNGTYFPYMFAYCKSLIGPIEIDTSNGTDFSFMFNSCFSLKEPIRLNTSKGTNFNTMFSYCRSLKTIELDIINATNVSSMFVDCQNLTNLTIKNIKISLYIGSSTYGIKLTLESLLNTIKELHDNSSSSSTLKLTVGTANLEKLTNVYVKLIDVTDEMIAADPYINSKLPFEVCESTDEGAMSLLEDYLLIKNWQIA